MKTKAAVLHDVHQDWQIEEITVDPPKANEVLVEWKVAGLCHSDEHIVTGDMGVSAEALAAMGATLACGGRNPLTGSRVVSERVARDVVSVMATCGVYDGSGRWMRRVGVPAKSSVSGALVLAAPGRLGAAVFSPPLDDQGTSVRGARLAQGLADALGLHAFGAVRPEG